MLARQDCVVDSRGRWTPEGIGDFIKPIQDRQDQPAAQQCLNAARRADVRLCGINQGRVVDAQPSFEPVMEIFGCYA
jgi:hypothetical protein